MKNVHCTTRSSSLTCFTLLLGLLSGCETENLVAAEFDVTIPAEAKVMEASIDAWIPPESRWLANQSSAAYNALASTRTTLLITPVAGGKNTFDPIERSLIVRMLGDRILEGSDATLANPDLVAQFFGSHRTNLDVAAAIRLATHTGTARVLGMRAVHDRAGHFDLTATVHSAPDWVEIRSRTWSGLTYSNAEPPSVAIASILKDLAEFALDESISPAPRPAREEFNAEEFLFPVSLADMAADSDLSNIQAAAHLQLLGMLHPDGAFNEARDHLFERSLVKLHKVSAKTPYRNYFVARAYALLDRRPAAMHALGEPKTVHDRALLAMLNGNLPALRHEFDQMNTSAVDFMTYMDLLELEASYNRRTERDVDEVFMEQSPAWLPFIMRALNNYSVWANYSSATLKAGLELLLPAQTPSLQSAFETAMITGDMSDELALTRMLFRHIDAFAADKIGAWAARKGNHLNASEIDVLNLARSLAVVNHLRRNHDDIWSRSLPEPALRRIAEFDSFYADHPAVTLQIARAKARLAEDAEGAEKRNLLSDSKEAYRRGFAWTGQLTADAAYVGKNIATYFPEYHPPGDPRQEFILVEPLRFSEWPHGGAWHQWISYTEYVLGELDRCIAYTRIYLYCVRSRIEFGEMDQGWGEGDREALVASISNRFIGHPSRQSFDIEMARSKGGMDGEVDQLRAQIAAGNHDWALYYGLGRALYRRGDYRGAEEVWLSYPKFQSGERLVLGEDSLAAEVGSLLFWVGQHELATPLYELSVNSGTGSEAQMQAGARIAQMRGDFAEAERWSAARVRRYRSVAAIRDLQQILHMTDQSEFAWSLFEQAQALEPNSQIWSGALTGHRLVGRTTADILEWIKASPGRQSAQVSIEDTNIIIDLAPRFLLLAGTLDRSPGAELAAAITEARNGKDPVYERYMRVDEATGERTIRSGLVNHHLRFNFHDDNIPLPGSKPDARYDDNVATRYEMLAHAMSAFLSDDYDAAFERFNRTAHFYELDEYLPYFAYAAASIGKADHLSAALEAREPTLQAIGLEERLSKTILGYRFDEDLTLAVLAAFDQQHDAALNYLKQALNNRPYIDDRTVYPYYQVVDLAERLYTQSNESAYKDFALDLARRHTVVLPMYAWAYIVVATYSESEHERISAAASGLHLDPLSFRATKLPAELLREARTVLEKKGPPYLLRSITGGNVGT